MFSSIRAVGYEAIRRAREGGNAKCAVSLRDSQAGGGFHSDTGEGQPAAETALDQSADEVRLPSASAVVNPWLPCCLHPSP